MTSFIYTPLPDPSRFVRLISVKRPVKDSRVQAHAGIYCDLRITPLAQASEYVALSYTWGDPNETLPIYLNGCLVQVTSNLHSALLHLRDGLSRELWVDAICINQRDDMEKSHQVQMMGQIYTRAHHVTVWLGPADDTSDMAMDYLNRLGEEAQACGMERLEVPAHDKWCELANKPVEHRDQGKIADGGYITYCIQEEDNPDKDYKVAQLWTNNLYYSISDRHDADMLFPVEAMAAFFKRKWWSRIWVLQEFALAKAVGFICGKKALTRRKCSAALATFATYRDVILTGIRTDDRGLTEYESAVAMADFDPRPKNMLSIRKNIQRAPITLISLLKMTCVEHNQSMKQREHSLQATDPRDKIYGLLGIASDYDGLKRVAESLNLRVTPNYALSCAQIYTDFTMAIMMQGYPSILSLCQSPKSVVGLPSWVPDWSVPMKLQLQTNTSIHKPALLPQYLACGQSSAAQVQFFWTDKNESICSISGFTLDKIAATGTSYSDITGKSEDAVAWVREWVCVLNNLSKQRAGAYESDDERMLAVVRTTTADFCVDEAGTWARATEQGLVAASMIHWLGADEEDIKNSGFLNLLEQNGLPPRVDHQAFGDIGGFRYIGDVGLRCRARRPFVTENGYLGLGPMEADEGDKVVIFAGLQVPFILRPYGSMYRLVGEAYVDGVMDGEAFEAGGVTEKIFLC